MQANKGAAGMEEGAKPTQPVPPPPPAPRLKGKCLWNWTLTLQPNPLTPTILDSWDPSLGDPSHQSICGLYFSP